VLFLNGLTFSEARKFLAGELARYYLPAEVKLNVSMGMLRSVRFMSQERPNGPVVITFIPVYHDQRPLCRWRTFKERFHEAH